MKFLHSILDARHKNNKLLYYLTNLFRQLLPPSVYRSQLPKKLAMLADFDEQYIMERVNYYNKLKIKQELKAGTRLSNFKLRKESKVYFFDSYVYTRYFNPELRIKVP